MAALAKVAKFSTQLINRKPGLLYTAVRSYWNKDFKPGPVPKTEEERLAAAEKYNLHPDKYETYPDDGTGYGDYPKLPMISTEARDPFYPWDYPEFLRNFKEPINVYEEMINDTRYNVSYRHRFSLKEQWLTLFGVLGTFAGLYYFLEDKKEFPPILAKQMPNMGEAHFMFDDSAGSKPEHH